MGSAAVREAVRHLDGWTIALWLRTESVWDKDVGKLPAGPMRGTIEINGSEDSFAFHRPGRAVVRIRFDQVAMWDALAPPPRPPLPVEQVPRR